MLQKYENYATINNQRHINAGQAKITLIQLLTLSTLYIIYN